MEKTAWLPLGRHRPNTLPKRAVERRAEKTGGEQEELRTFAKTEGEKRGGQDGGRAQEEKCENDDTRSLDNRRHTVL